MGLQSISRKFEENVQSVSNKFYVACNCNSSQLPEQREGLFPLVIVLVCTFAGTAANNRNKGIVMEI